MQPETEPKPERCPADCRYLRTLPTMHVCGLSAAPIDSLTVRLKSGAMLVPLRRPWCAVNPDKVEQQRSGR